MPIVWAYSGCFLIFSINLILSILSYVVILLFLSLQFVAISVTPSAEIINDNKYGENAAIFHFLIK